MSLLIEAEYVDKGIYAGKYLLLKKEKKYTLLLFVKSK